VIIKLRLWPDQNRQINHLRAGRSFGEGQGGVWERVRHRDEWLIWPLDQHRPVKRITETEASSTRG
jgi:hypothetical protein